MSRYVGFNNGFNAGELAETFWGRSDLAAYAKGCAEGTNMLGLLAGPAQRRGGFWDAGATKGQVAADMVRLVPFKRSVDDAVMLELGDDYLRVWGRDYTPVMDGMAPYEIASPYAAADLAGLRWTQSGDVLVFTHASGLIRPKSLVRSGATSWAFHDYVFEHGPWRPENITRTHLLTFTGTITAGGTGVLEASTPTFDAAMVGGLFRLRQNLEGAGTEAWAPGYTRPGGYVSFPLVLSNGRVYERTGGANDISGMNPPVHDDGALTDGNITWTYVHDGSGELRVTAYNSPTEVEVEVLRRLPVESGVGTSYWAEAAYSDYRGWPRAAPAIREERLIFAGPTAEPDKFHASRTAGFRTTSVDMTPGLGTGRVVDDDAVTRRAGDDGARVCWLMSSTFLIAGTRAAELVITGATIDDPITPAGTTVRGLSEFGSEDIPPVKAWKDILFVARGAENLFAISLRPDQSSESRDLSVLASHVGERGLAEIVWTAQPDNLAWIRLADGGLAAMAYHPQEGVYGWWRQEIGGGPWVTESLGVIPGYGARDALWLVATRGTGATFQRRIMVLSRRVDGMRLDAAKLYEGAPASGVDGMDHREGETVTLRARRAGGWSEYPGRTVTAGEVTLPAGAEPSDYIVAGVPNLMVWESLPLELQGAGTQQGRLSRPTQADVIVHGVDFRFGQTDGTLERVTAPRETTETTYVAAKRFAKKVTFAGGADRDPRVRVECDTGDDLIIYAIRPKAEVNG